VGGAAEAEEHGGRGEDRAEGAGAVIEPLLSDDALMADIEEVRVRHEMFDLWWLGQSGFLLHWQGNFILIDPYLSDSLTTKYAATEKPHVRMARRVVDPARLTFVTLLTSSHNHTDHLDPDTLRPLLPAQQHFGGFVAPAANLDVVVERAGSDVKVYTRGLDDGVSVATCRTRITGIAAAHDKIDRDEQGRCKYLGYVFEFGRWTVYHSGDTVLYEGLADRLRKFRVDLAILPINGKVGNMGGRDAARLAKEIGARVVMPCHYDMFEFNTADPREEFVPECERLGQPYRVLRLGERFSSSEIPAR
jgi:L-ascorbate metabolism protein UlaG (beta-lactamase superfamily)